jgi:enterochelin esterase-like enzyme
LPPNYKETPDQPYPFFLFLDGSDYLSNIPALSILDKMINAKEIPPCIAVFFDYSPDRRLLEYYCDQKFTYFLTHDLISLLQSKHHLAISDDPKLKTIVGFSASGLAALYAGLIYPTIFGNVITQSAALWSVKKSSLKNLVDEFCLMNQESCFIMEAGTYENVPLACEFMDGDTQAISINQSNKELVDYMKIKRINASFHEFIGGHNYVCWRNSLFDRLKELFEIRHNKANELKNFHGKKQ